MSLKRKVTFEELLAENRQHILKDKMLMEQLERKWEQRMHKTVYKK
ncbi:FbpB family small basic protein [Virgibacillus halodenitrificans]|uniref:FbpB family small basic protein n=1 Tax=Virgibacillus halodenitrificans TaxID=1482 RepID=A0ABR7VQU5_VIRHA|nr:FbpB family small basic protein [Virgibacillus halodenitrificans]MCG1028403.1 FbpB family small basic protein [Virgibacillus halodenitrificans]MYL45359.1 FbpB family small basic protein [Virgibacillus halodenitrificans]MYL57520.1 FbpB family small basic protein [Virgibacillus halodenitrificans]